MGGRDGDGRMDGWGDGSCMVYTRAGWIERADDGVFREATRGDKIR